MEMTTNPVERIKRNVIQIAEDPIFIHHLWYVTHHLTIVESISLELCDRYPNADVDLVLLLVWMHDYEKITRQVSPESKISEQDFLTQFGISSERIQQVLNSIEIIDRKNPEELCTAPIEIQILSSADGASHLVGSFFSIYWWENPTLSIEELRSRNLKKLTTDWERKIVLPEVKKAFESQYLHLLNSYKTDRPKHYF
jgi:hypothetical protein